jgi:hypothetical protein
MSIFNNRLPPVTTLACLAALAVPLTSACNPKTPLPTEPLTENERLASIKNMGNGIFVLPKKDFTHSISIFIRSNPDIKIVTITDGPFAAYVDQEIMKGVAGPTNVILVTKDLEESKKQNVDKNPIMLNDYGIKDLGNGTYLFPTNNFPETLAAFNNGINGNVTSVSYGDYHSFPNPNGKGYLFKPENYFVVTDQFLNNIKD